MALPTTTHEYVLPKFGAGLKSLTTRDAQLGHLKTTEVLVKIHAVSLQFRDLLFLRAHYPHPSPDNLVPCSDMAGEIIAIGEDIHAWKVGERVCANFFLDYIDGDLTPEVAVTALGGAIDGVLTQYKIFPAHSLVAIPDHLSYEEASTLPCAALTAYAALTGSVPLKAGDTLLVQGTGGVSIFGLQFAIAAGAIVIATSSSDEKLKLAAKLGAKHLINYKKVPNWEEEVLRITNSRGVDHVIEVGGADTIEKALKCTRMAGWVHIIGLLTSAGPANVIVDVIGRALHLDGTFVGSIAKFKDMNRLIAAHPDTTRPVIDKVFSFDQVQEAFAHLESQTHVGKVVIKVA